jgi:hypothetical protein
MLFSSGESVKFPLLCVQPIFSLNLIFVFISNLIFQFHRPFWSGISPNGSLCFGYQYVRAPHRWCKAGNLILSTYSSRFSYTLGAYKLVRIDAVDQTLITRKIGSTLTKGRVSTGEGYPPVGESRVSVNSSIDVVCTTTARFEIKTIVYTLIVPIFFK